MRIVIAATALALLAPAAYAQSGGYASPAPTPGIGGAPSTAAPGPAPGVAGGSAVAPVGAPASAQPDPSNCGTPDEPKQCPPMPRHPLRHYPMNRPGH